LAEKKGYFFGWITMRFRKDFNFKIFSLVIAVIFFSTNTAYAINSSEKSHLRLPLTERHNKQRLKDALVAMFNQSLRQYEKRIHEIVKISEYDDREPKLVSEYHGLLKSLDAHGYLNGTLIYPFMGPDLLPAEFIKTIPINRNSKDFERGEKIIERVYKDSSKEIVASIRSHIQSHEPLEAMEEATYLNLPRPDGMQFIFLMKGFKRFSDEYGEEAVEKLLSVVLENVLQEGDRVLILDNEDLAFMPKIQEAGFSSIAEYRLSLTTSERLSLKVEEDMKGVQIPDVAVVLEKRMSKGVTRGRIDSITLNILLEEAVSKNRIEEFYEYDSNYYMTISTWPHLLEERYKNLAEISKSLGDWCVIHNTQQENVEGILKEGVRPGKIGTGFMIYDFKNRHSIRFGLSHAAWQVMGGKLSIAGMMGYVKLDNIVAIIGDKSDRSIMINSKAIQDDIDAQGFSWYDITWGENATAHFAIDLSIDKEKLNAVINDFVSRHEEIPKEHEEAVISRLKQIAIVCIWMERLSGGIRTFIAHQSLKEKLNLLKNSQQATQTGN